MNFFEHQDAARRSTSRLVILFMLAVAGLVALTNLLAIALMSYTETGQFVLLDDMPLKYYQSGMFAAVTIAVIVLIAGGSFFKMVQLASGGRAVAEALGGTLVPRSSDIANQRRLLNVVEEMAIASGTPVPSVYILDEPGINAFAAGLAPGDAVIGVTRGTVEQLSRDELQGVIAHEFSHILNGDMKLNLRLTGVLHGILILGILGYYIVRMLRHSRSSSSEKGGAAIVALFLLGLGLMIIGYVGTFFGNIIKAMVSRQREYLADASSVQFTRNRDGIADALKKIGGAGSILGNPSAPEYSHAFFAQGVSVLLESMFATHPPLEKRIKRIQPRWDGKYIFPSAKKTEAEPAEAAGDDRRKQLLATMGLGTAATALVNEVDRVGQTDESHIGYARELLGNIPPLLDAEVRDSYGARAVIYVLLLHRDKNVRDRQWQVIREKADPGVYEKAQQLLPEITELGREYRLPLLDLAVPALRELSLQQYTGFRRLVTDMMGADNRIDLGEWVIEHVLMQHLDYSRGLRRRKKPVHSILGDVKQESELLLSILSYAEHETDEAARRAFDAGKKAIGAGALKFVPRNRFSIRSLDAAVNKLDRLKPLLKPRILKACAACIAADKQVTQEGIELLRAISASLDCPMPPIFLKN